MRIGTTRPALSDNVVSRFFSLLQRRVGMRLPWLALALVCIIVLAVFFGPVLLWSYHLEQGGRLMDQGLVWTEPRMVGSLPQVRDTQSLVDARAHLQAATRWQPNRAHAYRLIGQSYAAQADWNRAAEVFAHAQTLAPNNPVIAWEASLIYEQLWQLVDATSYEDITTAIANGQITAPDQPIETPFCRTGQPQTCYVGEITFAQPYAGLDAESLTELPAIFLHPPARISHEMIIPPEYPALRFVLGLDAAVYDQDSEDISFRIWVELSDDQQATLVYEHTLNIHAAEQGWVPAWADLSPWAGQTVRLILETNGGPAGDTTSDWYGWGDIALTTVEAAQSYALMPEARTRYAWRAVRGDGQTFVASGDAALEAQRYDAAYDWYTRSSLVGVEQTFDLRFRHAITAIRADQPDAPSLLTEAQALDPSFEVYELQDYVKIDGANLRWMNDLNPEQGLTYGTPLTYGYEGNTTAGFLWWAGEGVAVVSAVQAGDYVLKMQVQHRSPPPVHMAAGIDGTRVENITLERGDNSGQTILLSVYLTQGFHTIDIWFLNDETGDGSDRNAIIDWVSIERLNRER